MTRDEGQSAVFPDTVYLAVTGEYLSRIRVVYTYILRHSTGWYRQTGYNTFY